MANISKNIKRLRNTQNISQEALAEKLFISRQAVSSWENDRTQPDIEMIGKLAEVFNVSIEELIYGEKRKLELENEEPKQNNKLLIIIFSILGSLFVAIGLIPQNDMVKDLIKLNDYGYVEAGEDCVTNKNGIFVAGDCRSKRIRQVATAVADGAVAALAAVSFTDSI